MKYPLAHTTVNRRIQNCGLKRWTNKFKQFCFMNFTKKITSIDALCAVIRSTCEVAKIRRTLCLSNVMDDVTSAAREMTLQIPVARAPTGWVMTSHVWTSFPYYTVTCHVIRKNITWLDHTPGPVTNPPKLSQNTGKIATNLVATCVVLQMHYVKTDWNLFLGKGRLCELKFVYIHGTWVYDKIV